MRKYLKILLVLLIVLPLVTNNGCKSMKNGPSNAVQETRERQKEQEERQREKYEKARERHMSIQTDEAKERMEDLQKKSERYNQNKKKFFLVRWWEKIFHKRNRQTRPGGH